VYDGASAAAEAAAMCRDHMRTTVLVSSAMHPDTIATIRTYCRAVDAPMLLIPAPDGITDLNALKCMMDGRTACVILQTPNFYGAFENAEEVVAIAHAAGAKAVLSCNPLALAIMKTPGEIGADIAVAEGQPLGMPLSFGGPYLGIMASKSDMMRKLPGRIVGETTDIDGKRAFVLTLQAREQHIRREKAGSNICTNEALCALMAGAYMAAMGPDGMQKAAQTSMDNAHYLRGRLLSAGLHPIGNAPFFHEFLTNCPVPASLLMDALEQDSILGGLPVGENILWCATETVTRSQMDKTAEIVREVCGK
jgi:glycine dehydrogenase subunit 1